MNIPQTLNLSEIQRSFRDVQTALARFERPPYNINGQRIVNAGSAIEQRDYMTKFDVGEAIAASLLPDSPDVQNLIENITNVAASSIPQLQKAIPVAAAPLRKFLRLVINCLPGWYRARFPWPVD